MIFSQKGNREKIELVARPDPADMVEVVSGQSPQFAREHGVESEPDPVEQFLDLLRCGRVQDLFQVAEYPVRVDPRVLRVGGHDLSQGQSQLGGAPLHVGQGLGQLTFADTRRTVDTETIYTYSI